MNRPNSMQRLARATREALYATPILIILGWLGPEPYGYRVTLPRALCALAAIVATELVIDEDQPALEREVQILALGLVISFGLAGLVQLAWPGSV